MTRSFRAWLALLAFTAIALPARAEPTPPDAAPSAPAQAPSDTAQGAPSTAPEPAQPPSEAAAPAVDPNAVTEPKLVSAADAGYPEEALSLALEPSVDMVLIIGTDGFVERADLLGEPVGHGFDELALAAARRTLFEPATKGGVPIRAKIRYRYAFKLPQAQAPPVTETPAPPPHGRIELTVLSAKDGTPVQEAEVLIAPTSDPNRVTRLVTDAVGKVMLDALEPGTYEVSAARKGLQTELHQEEVHAGEITELTYRLSEQLNYEEYGAVARVKAPPREVTRRTIEREELTRVAGTRGDALRTIELLPGVSRPPLGAGLVLIRGSAPQDSQVFLDGVPVPLLYHFGGLTSFINSRALDKIDFYPGNFSVRYGRQIGGIIDVGVRDAKTDGYHGVVDVNLPLDSSLLVEGPINDKASFMVAGRRSYFGEVLTAAIPPGTFDAFAAPVYYDYQGFITYRPTDRDKIRFGSYGSSDALKVLFADAPDADPAIRAIEVETVFHRAQIGWSHQYSTKLDHKIEISYGRIDQHFSAGSAANFSLLVNTMYLRGEWRYRLSEAVQITAGTDSFVDGIDVKYTGPSPQQQEGNNGQGGGSFSQLPPISIRDQRGRFFPAGYVELDLRPIKKLRIIPGMRLDYFEDDDKFAFDPRVATIYSLTDTWRLKAGVGVFSQPPEPQESSPALGNPRLVPIKAIHYGAGFEHNFTEHLSLGVEGFYKSIHDRVVGTDFARAVAMGNDNPPPFENDGIGRIYGMEVAGRKLASGRWFGFLSYTLMRSERRDHDKDWRLFDFDQTHIFTAASTVRLGRGWELGGTLRFVTGNPRTPIAGASLDQNTALYTGENGRPNSIRAPTFNRLDIRAEKTWKFDAWRLAWYLDVQNAYNAKNPEGVFYNYNFKEKSQIRGLPIIPIIGLRGEL